jgi:hypothetical protein
MAIGHQFLIEDQVATTHIENGHINIHVCGLHTHLFNVLRYKNIIDEFDTMLQNLSWICVCTLHIDFTIEFLSFHDVYENVMVIGHHSFTWCYYFENIVDVIFVQTTFLFLYVFSKILTF